MPDERLHQQRFDEALAAFCSSEGAERVRHLIRVWQSLGGRLDYAREMIPGVRARLSSGPSSYSMWGAYVPEAGGKVGWKPPYFIVQFGNMVRARLSWDRLEEFAKRLRDVPWAGPIVRELERAGFRKKPSFPIDHLADAGVTEAVEDILRAVATG
jgi:hypothetical protein